MVRHRLLFLLALSAFVFTSVNADDSEDASPPDDPAAIPVEDAIAARGALMMAMEARMQAIDTYTVDDSIDPGVMRENAVSIAAMLLAFPHLFPAASNRYDPEDEFPETLALPAIWENFPHFYGLAQTASATATRLAETGDDPAALRAASLALRGTCDACHAVYLLPYETPTVSDEDLDFDFDAVFGDP